MAIKHLGGWLQDGGGSAQLSVILGSSSAKRMVPLHQQLLGEDGVNHVRSCLHLEYLTK